MLIPPVWDDNVMINNEKSQDNYNFQSCEKSHAWFGHVLNLDWRLYEENLSSA